MHGDIAEIHGEASTTALNLFYMSTIVNVIDNPILVKFPLA